MTEEQEIDEMINSMFENYMEGGFDFNSDMSFTEVFKQIFVDAVNMTISVYESEEE